MTKEMHKCDSKLSCKASASLNESVKAELEAEDKPLEDLLNEKDTSEALRPDTGEAGEG